MKKLISFLLFGVTLSGYGQINKDHNGIRIGDEIVKQQVEYKDPGRSGEQVVWNFSKLKPINKEYQLTYTQAPIIDDTLYILGRDSFLVKNARENEFIVGTEHQTMYYYRQTDSALLVLGHENSVNLLHHNIPVLGNKYPLDYNNLQQIQCKYKTDGLYSSRDKFKIEGTVKLYTDAKGMMILPSNDTVQHVIRLKKLQTFHDADSAHNEGDTPLNMEVETFQWYAKGYRYPIFETIRSYNIQDTGRVENFKTAFFFPPQEHYYLSDDETNLAVLDSIWNAGHKDNELDTPNQNMELGKNFAYNFYPNPVTNNLYLEYYLEESSSVDIAIYDLSGRLAFTLPEKQLSMGLYQKTIDCSSFENGTFILRLTVNNQVVNEKIIKK